MSNTPLHQYIEKMIYYRDNELLSDEQKKSVNYAINTAHELLHIEQAIIEESYNQGDSDRDNYQDGNVRVYKNCIHYYKTKFLK